MRKVREMRPDQIPVGSDCLERYMGPIKESKDAKSLAPIGANAYVVIKERETFEVRFYRL